MSVHETITTHCLYCGPIYLTPEDIRLRVTEASPTGYTWIFEHCGLEWERVATKRIIKVLQAVGCVTEDDFADWVESAIIEIREAETVEDLWGWV